MCSTEMLIDYLVLSKAYRVTDVASENLVNGHPEITFLLQWREV